MLFSQRQGLKPLKSAIQVESMDNDLRNSLWDAISIFCWSEDEHQDLAAQVMSLMKNEPVINNFYRRLCVAHFKIPVSSGTFTYRQVVQMLQDYFSQCQWFEAYDFLEFTASRYPSPSFDSTGFIEHCNSVLERELSAYRFVGGKIVKVTSELEIGEMEQALAETQPLKSVNTHLTTALDLLSNRKSPDYRNSIKESISAVEALCRLITGSKATLDRPLR